MAKKISLKKLIAAVESDSYIGFCVNCGNDAEGVEPDAEYYKCDVCGLFAVHGAENLLISGGTAGIKKFQFSKKS